MDLKKIVSLGELLLRLSPPDELRLSQTRTLDMCFGGSELNVTSALALWKCHSALVTALPDNNIGQIALKEVENRKVITDHIVLTNGRLGLYYQEKGVAQRGGQVLYDREGSTLAKANNDIFDWDRIFKDATHFHWSGITPGISDNAAKICLKAVKKADDKGLTISTDINYRKKLWQYGKRPQEVMKELLSYSNILLGDISTICMMMGMEDPGPDYDDMALIHRYYNMIQASCPNLMHIATTVRKNINASRQKISGLLYHNNQLYKSSEYDIYPVVDRVGTGDAFMAGLLYGHMRFSNNTQKMIELAAASCCLKHTIVGDFNEVLLSEVEQLINKENVGILSR